jgi:hypothetical protein
MEARRHRLVLVDLPNHTSCIELGKVGMGIEIAHALAAGPQLHHVTDN